jgi:hypothetical protein
VKHLGPARRTLAAIVAVVLVLVAIPAVAASAVGPTLLKPRKNAVVARNTQPTFSVHDLSSNARKYKVWITIASKKRVKKGELQMDRGPSGTFSSMRRRAGGRYTYKPRLYTFPTYFLQRPGRYWWQTYHIDCSVRAPSCHILSRIRSFVVR